MKKLYLLAAAALCAATATAANGDVTDGWLMLEDFEGTAPALSTFKTDGSGVGTGTSEVVVYKSKDGNENNHVGKFTAKDARTDGFLLTVTLPAGKTIADYTAIKLDLVGINTSYKSLDLYIDGNKVYTQGNNPIGGQGAWNSHSHDITVTGGNTITIGFYNYLGAGNQVAFDNIQLKEKEGGSGEDPDPVEPVDPVEPGESLNGTVTGGWLMVEDFEATAPTMSAFNIYSGEGKGTCETATIAKDGNNANKVGQFTVGGGWSHGIQFDFTLPEGKTIADYTEISVDIYGVSGDVTWKKLEVYVDGSKQGEVSSAITNATTWKTSNLEISATGTSNKVTIGFYNATNTGAVIAYDNIRLKEKPTSGVYNESKNGTVTDGWLMIEDFQKKVPGDNVKIAAQWGEDRGTTAIEIDPENAKNLVAAYAKEGDDYNSVFALNVNLPEGKTLKDYDKIAFDLYRYDGDADDKQMLVKAGNEQIHLDSNYPKQAESKVWTAKSYDISVYTEEGSSFTLLFGIKSDNPHYAVDNVRLHEADFETRTRVIDLTYETKASMTWLKMPYILHVNNHAEDGNTYEVTLEVKDADDNTVGTFTGEHSLMTAATAPARTLDPNAVESTHKLQGEVTATGLEGGTNYTATLTVKHNGNMVAKATKTETISTTTTGIEDVTVDSEAPVEYFNLQGLRIAQPEAGQLYIKRQGDKAVKVRF